MTFAALPSRSPTVVLIWASAILSVRMTLTPSQRDYRRASGKRSIWRRRYDASVTTTASADVTVRKLQLAEIEELAAAIPEVTDAQLANRWREQTLGYRELLVAERNGELVGTVSIAELSRPSSIHLFALEVVGKHRNEGIGAEIVRWVVDEARRRGRERVFLEVRTDNPARRLYHRLGFRRVGPAFVNSWWLFNADGTQTRMEELSIRMVKRVRYGATL